MKHISMFGFILALLFLLGGVGAAFKVKEHTADMADEAFIIKDHDDTVETLPEDLTISFSPVRHAMSKKEREIDGRVSARQLRLPDGRPVTVYHYDAVSRVIVGGVEMKEIAIDTVSPIQSGREAVVLFVNREGQAFRPPRQDVGVWNEAFEWIGFAYSDVPQHATQLHLTLAVDTSGSMGRVMAKVKRIGKAFLKKIPHPNQSQCSIVSFNRLTTVHAGVSFKYVLDGGHIFDERVRDVATEQGHTDFANLYPEAILTSDDHGNRDKLKALIQSGNWGIPCQKAGRFVDQIGPASGGTNLMTPVSLALETAAVIQSVPEGEHVKLVLVLISDGADTENPHFDTERLRKLKAQTGATIFMYWPSSERDRSALQGLIDFEMASDQESQAAIEAYLKSITVWLAGKQVLTLQS